MNRARKVLTWSGAQLQRHPGAKRVTHHVDTTEMQRRQNSL